MQYFTEALVQLITLCGRTWSGVTSALTPAVFGEFGVRGGENALLGKQDDKAVL